MFSRDGAPPSEPSLCLNGVSEPPPSLAASSQLRGDFDTGEAPPPAVAVARLAPYETTRTSSRTQTSKQVARETGQVSIPGMSRLPSVEDLALVMHASRLGTESEPPLVVLSEVVKYLEERHTQSAPTQLERRPPSLRPLSLEQLSKEAEEDRGMEGREREREEQEAAGAAREEQEERDREGRYHSTVEQAREEPAFLPMESVGAALSSLYDYRPPDRPQPSLTYSFDHRSPVLASSSLQTLSSSRYPTSNPYELYSATPSSPYSYPRELIWSRTQQEQQLALQQRQQREQLQLQLQQQDERYQQEAHQRLQQENLRLQQSSYGSYPGLSFSPTSRQPSYLPPSSHLYGLPLPSSPEPIVRQASRARDAYDQSSRQREAQAPRLDRALNPGEQSREAGYEHRTIFYDEEGTAAAEGGSTGTSQRYFAESGSPPGQGFGQRGWPPLREDWSGAQQLRSPRHHQQLSLPLPPQHQYPRQYQHQRMPSGEMDSHRNDPRRTHILSSPPPRPRPDLPTPHPSTHSTLLPVSIPILSLPAPPPPSHSVPVPPALTLLPHPPPPSLIPPPPLPAPSHAHFKPDHTAGETLRSGLPLVPDRSPWAMWAGNIPADATHEELWTFFSSRSGPEGEKAGIELEGEGDLMRSSGVESIHLIGRSNCAFINYLTEAHLEHAIRVCTGLLLRPLDRRCKPLLCRVRMREDDAKSGVGAQRGSGMHKAYVEAMGRVEVEGREEENGKEEENGSEEGSTASTASSLFARHFSKRFFILKSHNNEDLETSVKSGLWRTQPHNEAVLDQAYRTARDGVFLVFSVNRSREWFGYAKMAGPIPPAGESGVLWSPSSPVLSSPGPMPSMTDSISSRSDVPSPESLQVDRGMAQEAPPSVGDDGSQQLPEARGRPFRVDWIKVQRLPFVRTRHIFNSFNQNREVKISRDGTEIEPVAGEQLLREFWLMKPKPPVAPRSHRPLKPLLPPSDSSAWSQLAKQVPESFGRRT